MRLGIIWWWKSDELFGGNNVLNVLKLCESVPISVQICTNLLFSVRNPPKKAGMVFALLSIGQ